MKSLPIAAFLALVLERFDDLSAFGAGRLRNSRPIAISAASSHICRATRSKAAETVPPNSHKPATTSRHNSRQPGLQPMGDDGTYFQTFRSRPGTEFGRTTRITINGNGARG